MSTPFILSLLLEGLLFSLYIWLVRLASKVPDKVPKFFIFMFPQFLFYSVFTFRSGTSVIISFHGLFVFSQISIMDIFILCLKKFIFINSTLDSYFGFQFVEFLRAYCSRITVLLWGHIVLAVIDFVIMLASRHLGCGLIINLGADIFSSLCWVCGCSLIYVVLSGS